VSEPPFDKPPVSEPPFDELPPALGLPALLFVPQPQAAASSTQAPNAHSLYLV
jgi:hypothetical protein